MFSFVGFGTEGFDASNISAGNALRLLHLFLGNFFTLGSLGSLGSLPNFFTLGSLGSLGHFITFF
jgi:hypothetical protein